MDKYCVSLFVPNFHSTESYYIRHLLRLLCLLFEKKKKTITCPHRPDRPTGVQSSSIGLSRYHPCPPDRLRHNTSLSNLLNPSRRFFAPFRRPFTPATPPRTRTEFRHIGGGPPKKIYRSEQHHYIHAAF